MLLFLGTFGVHSRRLGATVELQLQGRNWLRGRKFHGVLPLQSGLGDPRVFNVFFSLSESRTMSPDASRRGKLELESASSHASYFLQLSRRKMRVRVLQQISFPLFLHLSAPLTSSSFRRHARVFP